MRFHTTRFVHKNCSVTVTTSLLTIKPQNSFNENNKNKLRKQKKFLKIVGNYSQIIYFVILWTRLINNVCINLCVRMYKKNRVKLTDQMNAE